MQDYVVANWLSVPASPGVPAPGPGSPNQRAANIERLIDYRWRCALVHLNQFIGSGEIQIANPSARILRMRPELRQEVRDRFRIDLEEYDIDRRVEVAPEPPRPQPPTLAADRPFRIDRWHLRAIGLPPRARRPDGVGRGKGVDIIVIDTGVDGEHRELKGRIRQALTVDSVGRIKPVSRATDSGGHGTYVSALIAGRTVGVAPAANLISIQIAGENGATSDAAILKAYDWAAGAERKTRSKVRIAVLCFGRNSDQPSSIYQSIMSHLLDLDVLPVISIGNEGPGRPAVPGNSFGAVSVGAITRKGAVASFSGSGACEFAGYKYSVPSLVAPGDSVVSAIAGERFQAMSGTTPSTAIAAGVAALLAEQRPDLDAWGLRNHLLSLCHPLAGESDERQGAGILRVVDKDAR